MVNHLYVYPMIYIIFHHHKKVHGNNIFPSKDARTEENVI